MGGAILSAAPPTAQTRQGSTIMNKKIRAYCKTCKEMIDITDVPFISYADEDPMVLDMQLTQPSTERKAINFVKRQGVWNFDDWGDQEEKMYHYNVTGSISHMEPGDDEHNLDITGGYWGVQ